MLKSRWSQEANFKWMRREYGLDTLAEHATEEVAAETRVVNPGAREIRRGLERLRALPAARRGLQEGQRLIAYRAETALAAVLAPHLGKPAEGARPDQGAAAVRRQPAARPRRPGTLTVQLQHTACRAHDEALAALLEELNRTPDRLSRHGACDSSTRCCPLLPPKALPSLPRTDTQM